ncbi:hypothetical protein GCM10009760_55180 [Kitasatospora kazusensis]|uniref:DUF2637 domain-containing protein n=1 Tax=Kitasatospora kazusensis TaxID=407974 RepID=A0ABP5M1L2_9ACTN
MARPSLTRAHRVLLGLVAAGACLISGIGFAGSYNAVRELALHKGFGTFAYAFPIGVDAGIVVLLALDLVLTWLRIPFPLLRQTAWLLTAATIAFNAAASWGDALGMAMHAVIPVLFVVVVEASRHAVGRIADITADRHMESVRLMRWLLSPVPTFRLWRRMKLWELRSYDETVRLEQNRLVYRAQLRFRYGRGWRRSAPFQALLPLKLAKYGVPLDPTILDRIDGPLEIQPVAQPAAQTLAQPVAQPVAAVGPTAQSPLAAPAAAGPAAAPAAAPTATAVDAAVAVPTLARLAAVRLRDAQEPAHAEDAAPLPPQPELNVWMARAVPAHSPHAQAAHTARVPGQASPWFKPPRPLRPGSDEGAPAPVPLRAAAPAPGPAQAPAAARPAAQPAPVAAVAVAQASIGHRPVRLEQLGHSEDTSALATVEPADIEVIDEGAANAPRQSGRSEGDRRQAVEPLDPDVCFQALVGYIDQYGHEPDVQSLAEHLTMEFGVVGSRPDGAVNPAELEKILPRLRARYADSGRD